MTRDIIMIYDAYHIPEGLRLHMLRVAGIGQLIASNWSGPRIDSDQLIRVLLLHDMGNIVKMHDASPGFSAVRTRYEVRYGNDDHAVSEAIARELGLGNADIALMQGKVFMKNDETAASPDYQRKIGAYADQRVSPAGVVSLHERLDEARDRYRDRPGSSMNNPRTAEMIRLAHVIERQVMKHCTLSPAAITEEAVAGVIPYLSKVEIDKG